MMGLIDMNFERNIPKRLLLIAVLCWIIPFINEFLLDFEYEFIWSIYIVPSMLFAYYYGFKGGVTAAIIGFALEGAIEARNYYLGNFEEWWIQFAISILIINFIVAIGVGFLAEKFHKMNKLLKELAIKDGLTEAHNHRFFHQQLDKHIKANEKIKLILIDLDNFKQINDTLGHQTGDNLLKSLTKLIISKVGDSNFVFRYGGDEFAVIFKDFTIEATAMLAEGIRLAVEEAHFLGNSNKFNGKVTLSIGIASFPDLAQNKQHLIELADRALYLAKQTKNKVVINNTLETF
jgi:diguanylate cyclase (GGDEF)-like protein